MTGLERRIEAGNFMLADTMTMPEIADALQTALFEEALVTIPEGFMRRGDCGTTGRSQHHGAGSLSGRGAQPAQPEHL
ncbi:MAG: hypothetical protein R2854_00350 [Caldilineaceae bacterium]